MVMIETRNATAVAFVVIRELAENCYNRHHNKNNHNHIYHNDRKKSLVGCSSPLNAS